MEWPSVTVIVLNYNGMQHLHECLNSLVEIDYPTNRLELMLVDNASVDNSVVYVRENFPSVRILQNSDNLGFAAGNNRAAQAAAGDYIAFLNNDTRVDPNWIRELVRPCLEEQDVVCTAAKMLSWDGKVVDFVRSAMNFHGFAFQPNYGLVDTFGTPYPLLFACGGAMLIRKDVFHSVGGFDEDYFMYFEDMDLGWRLWLMGYQVLFVPSAVVYHKLHASSDALASFRKWVLFERNALISLLKNYDESNMYRVLSASLLLMFRRAGRLLQEGGWDVHAYNIRNPQGYDLAETVSRAGLSVLVAANEVIDQLPRIFEKRKQIQTRRKRSDAEIFQVFGLPTFVHPMLHVDSKVHYDIGHYLGVTDLFERSPRRILLIGYDQETTNVDPLPASEGKLSLQHVGDGLESFGHSVFYGLCRGDKLKSPLRQSLHQVYFWKSNELDGLLGKLNPEIVVVFDEDLLKRLKKCSVPVIYGLTGDVIYGRSRQEDHLDTIRIADLLIFSNTDQQASYENATSTSSQYPRSIVLDFELETDDVDVSREAQTIPGMQELDRFCRAPRKMQNRMQSSSADSSSQAMGDFSTPPPSKSVSQLLREAYFHFHRGGIRVFTYEVLGFLQKQVAKHL